MSLTKDDIARRRAAKRLNERLKLLATFFNNSAIATFVGGFVLPYQWIPVPVSNGVNLDPAHGGRDAWARASCAVSLQERRLIMDQWIIFGPLTMLAVGLAGYVWLRWESAQFDRRFGRGPE